MLANESMHGRPSNVPAATGASGGELLEVGSDPVGVIPNEGR